MEFEYLEQYKYLTNICLNVTDSCNLACKYCFVEQHPHFMRLQTAKDSVDYLFQNYTKKKELGVKDVKTSIAFFGGEPMLLWDEIIVPTVLYAEEKYPDVFSFGMTTNGTLLNKERIDFMKEHGIFPHLSIDGYKTTQDANRPCRNGKSSFDMLFPNIPYLLQNFPNVTYRATIDQETAGNTFENYLFADYLGFNNIFMIPNGREHWSEENKEILKKEVEKIYLYMANCFLKEKMPINFSSINESFTRVLENDLNTLNPTAEINCSRNPNRCGLGTTFGSIGYDGKIYGCQEQNSKDEKNIFLIGDIYNGGINLDLHTKLLKEYSKMATAKCENEVVCQECKFRNICKGHMCPSSSWDLFKSFTTDSEMHCRWIQYLFDNALVLMKYLTEKNNLFFKKYLDEQCGFKKHFPIKEDE